MLLGALSRIPYHIEIKQHSIFLTGQKIYSPYTKEVLVSCQAKN